MHRPLTANTSIDVENVTEGYIHTDEGRIKITQECTFMVYHKNLRFGIEVSHVDEDHDTYSIKVFNQSAEKDRYRREDIFDNPNNSNEICHCYLDSTGGGVYDEMISTGIDEVDTAIMDTLFGREDLNLKPLITAF